MGFLKKNLLLTIIILLDLFITVLCLVLGILMYSSNSKSIIRNNAYVDITGMISNIGYGLHFGKSVESYYGMDKELSETVNESDIVDAMYVVSDSGQVLFSTEDKTLPRDVLKASVNSTILHGHILYCVHYLTDEASIITESDISAEMKEWNMYFIRLFLVCIAGFTLSSALMCLIHIHSKKKLRGYHVNIAVLILWILIISFFIGYSAYMDYNLSLNDLSGSVLSAIDNGMESVHALGIKNQNISGIDDYLKRFSENINEIEEIVREGDKYRVITSSAYMRRVTVDYFLQTFLFLTFSAMILAEFQIFMTETGIKGLGDDSNA